MTSSIERDVENAIAYALTVAGVTGVNIYTSERTFGRLLPFVSIVASIKSEEIAPLTGIFDLNCTITYVARADTISDQAYDQKFASIQQAFYTDPNLASQMTSTQFDLEFYIADITRVGQRIISTSRTWARDIFMDVKATFNPAVLPNPSLLLHMDGANGSTNFIDNSLNNFTITPYGNAQISTAQYKFGGASGLFDRDDTTYVGRASNSNFAFESDFTIEMWVYMIENNIGYQAFLSTHTDGLDATGWVFLLESNGNIYFYGSDGTQSGPIGGWNCQIVTETYPDSEQWVHIAVVRYNNVITIYKDGVDVTSARYGTQTVSISSAQNFEIGHYTPLPEGNKTAHCYIDELRIVKGYAAYTSNFTPPNQPFPNP